MAVRNIAVTDTIEKFRTEFNAMCLNDFGDIGTLTGSIRSTTVVGAVNEAIAIISSTAGWTMVDSTSTTQIVGGGQEVHFLGTSNEVEAVVSGGNNVTIGHMVMLHGCTIGDNSLIGIGAVVLNRAKIGKNCIIGAISLVTERKEIPDNSMVVGIPGMIIKSVDTEMEKFLEASAEHYCENWLIFSKKLNFI